MIRLGIVDFDSSHSIEFTRRFNHAGVDSDQYVEGARVVAGCSGSSLMAPERIPGFAEQVASCGVELVESPEMLLERIDAVLVLSQCGTAHLERVRPFLEAGIPAFVDKPFACTLDDARQMIQLANENNVTLFNSSALRFSAEIEQFQNRHAEYGATHGAITYGPAKRAHGNPGLFHYGIHAVEVLFALMGPGCHSVTTEYTEDAEVVTARWSDGRLATVRGNRQGATTYGFMAFTENAVIHQPISTRFAYRNLCQRIVKTFETGTPAVANDSSLEIVKFITASLDSERQGGATVPLDSDS